MPHEFLKSETPLTLQELDIAIRTAAKESDPKDTSVQLAERFYEENRELIEPLTPQWVIEKLASLLAKHRAVVRRENAPQFVLFELSMGLKHLPARIEKHGKRIARDEATIGVLRGVARRLRKTETPAYLEVKRAITLMQPYTRKNQRITWGEVVAREAEKAAKKAGKSANKPGNTPT